MKHTSHAIWYKMRGCPRRLHSVEVVIVVMVITATIMAAH